MATPANFVTIRAAAPTGFRPTTPGRISNPTSSYSTLLVAVKQSGLMVRRRGYYLILFCTLMVCLVAVIAGSFALGHSWFQLLVAAAVGVLLTQFAFLAHETAHKQVFESGQHSERWGRVLAAGIVGISYAWWMNKHTRHHGNPNTSGRDPDIAPGALIFTPTGNPARTGLAGLFARHQGHMFFPLLILEGLNLHVTSYRALFTRKKVTKRALEIALISTHFLIYVGALLWFLPLGMAFAFLGVQMAAFGFYMGASFAPNHKGMTLLEPGSKVDFLSKQVLTSRNIGNSALMTTVFGGLNFQIEHHLFPNMPRPHLRQASVLVQKHCAIHEIPYTQTSLLQSYRIVIDYLNRVGLAAGGDPFDCPAASTLRP